MPAELHLHLSQERRKTLNGKLRAPYEPLSPKTVSTKNWNQRVSFMPNDKRFGEDGSLNEENTEKREM
jgi:hypothetical protein